MESRRRDSKTTEPLSGPFFFVLFGLILTNNSLLTGPDTARHIALSSGIGLLLLLGAFFGAEKWLDNSHA
ncbi:hypothetical protein [Shouchella shacheensis]|uniref:hypothetical protein n=1 Tax=Shouchella shacheensis TaxID=1649580 RepID=UPI00074035C9|nr:hypothetical protein [Shouchella shacheensis]